MISPRARRHYDTLPLKMRNLAAALAPFLMLFPSLSARDNPAADYNQPYRPQFHFSPRQHWTNDPNGLVYFEGEYHLFFQYNPYGDEWGHMSWGHAVSRDLTHWTQLPVAIPEENGIMIFTGSAVVDEHNTSGFCLKGKPCLVAVYTGHRPETPTKPALQTQNVAFSNDRGRTWTKYSGNPVLNLNMSDFRDPKVFWSKTEKRWIMAVALPNDHKVRFYSSANLKSWKPLGDFGPAGATSGQWECPELFELPVDGNQAHMRWVLKIGLNPGALQGGSGEQYFIGRFDGRKFINENAASQTLWTDYGKDCYCALTFNGLPQSHAPVMIGWMDNWQYAAALPTRPWRGQMTMPRKLSLRTTPEGIRLVQQPADELSQLRDVHRSFRTGGAEGATRSLATLGQDPSHVYEFQANVALGDAREVGWKLLATDGTYTLVGYNRDRRELFVDRTKANGVSFSPKFPARTAAPLNLAGDSVDFHLFIDRSSVELFAGEGRITMTNLIFPPQQASGITFYANGGKPGRVSADVWKLGTIW